MEHGARSKEKGERRKEKGERRVGRASHSFTSSVRACPDSSGRGLRRKAERVVCARSEQEPRFILDVHLGRLAKYLRLCGFDTLYSSHYSDPEIIDISIRDDRIILTRDRLLLKDKRIRRGYRIRSQNHEEQMREVFQEFNLRNQLTLFCRCIRCNTPLEEVPKQDILHRIQADTTRYYSNFSRCPECDRIYWDGSHYNNMKKFIERIYDRLE